MMANEFEENRGSAMGMFNFIRYTGMACGPVISGMLLGMSSSVFVFGCFGIVYAAARLFDDRGHAESTTQRRRKNQTKKPPGLKPGKLLITGPFPTCLLSLVFSQTYRRTS